jgi:hypothetical protein
MSKNYELYDESCELEREYKFDLRFDSEIIGELMISREKREMKLKDGVELTKLPYKFSETYQSGARVFGSDEVDEWISGRVVERSRMNLSDILHNLQMERYNVFKLFIAMKGRYNADNYSITDLGEEFKEAEYPKVKLF